jgi:preprotein translocase subunit SecD
MIRGFAVTLILGIFIGIFTGVFVTRNLLRVFAKEKLPVNSKK